MSGATFETFVSKSYVILQRSRLNGIGIQNEHHKQGAVHFIFLNLKEYSADNRNITPYRETDRL